jgi:tetratricopeptide (TPR) repeat protein
MALGSRLFLDIFTNKKPQQEKVAEKPVTAEKPEQAQPPAKIPEIPKPAPTIVEATTPTPVTPAPVQETSKKFTGSAVITVSASEGLTLASFERNGYLWVVVSKENMTVPPVISGPSAQALGTPETFDITGGQAYRFKMPEGAFIRPQGASLVWQIFVEDRESVLNTSLLTRDFSDITAGAQVLAGLKSANSVLRLKDPEMGDDLAVVTVGRSDSRLLNTDQYVDFEVLPAYVGAVFKPKADGLRVAVEPAGVRIGRQGGLRISPEGPRTPVDDNMRVSQNDPAQKQTVQRLFNLQDWSMGGPENFLDGRRAIDIRIAAAGDTQKVSELVAGAKFMLGQGLPQEGLGFLDMAAAYLPILLNTPDFQALRGALLALAGQVEDAEKALMTKGIETNPESHLWRAFALAKQGRVIEAEQAIPSSVQDFLESYPPRVQVLMLPALIEAALAQGNVGVASTMMDLYKKAATPDVDPDAYYALSYLKGRLALLQGDLPEATKLFEASAAGQQGEYPVRAALALVERGLAAKTIKREDVIAKLERFRYAWRGDALESEVLQRLGLVYVTGGAQRLGLTILRDAASITPEGPMREKLVAVMQKAFIELFSGKTLDKMTPLEAAAVATDFAELMPVGADGEAISLNIADQMVAVDLLDRAADIIEPLVESTAAMADAFKYAQKAAAIRITDDKPERALRIIDKALSRPDVQALAGLEPSDLKAFALLRAKAKAQQKRLPEAFAELDAVPEDADTLRIKADIAWSAQNWPLAAEVIGKLVGLAGLDATKPLNEEQAQMILNRALALNLSSNLTELENLRLGYGDIMRSSPLNQAFQVVTRTAREAKLADRATLLKLVSEVNMFKAVLEGYKVDPQKQPPAASVPAPQSPTQPAQTAQ